MKEGRSVIAKAACAVILQTVFFGAAAQTGVHTSGVKDLAQTTADSTGVQTPTKTAADSTGTKGSAPAVEKNKIHSLYAGTGFGSNMVYLGTTISDDKPFGYASVAYGFKDHLYLSATGYSLSGFTPFLAYYSLDMSFSHTFNSWFDIGLSLSRYNVNESLQDTLFSSFTYANATLGFDWRILYTQISAGGLFAEDSWLYLQARNSRYFETPSFAGGKAFFSFDPYVNLIFGTIIDVKTSENPARSVPPGKSGWHRPPKDPSTSYSERFGLMEMDFGLPVDFSYDFFTIEVEPGYVLPFYTDTGAHGTKGFVFLASAFFRIF